jgi:hypothetical protein
MTAVEIDKADLDHLVKTIKEFYVEADRVSHVENAEGGAYDQWADLGDQARDVVNDTAELLALHGFDLNFPPVNHCARIGRKPDQYCENCGDLPS